MVHRWRPALNDSQRSRMDLGLVCSPDQGLRYLTMTDALWVRTHSRSERVAFVRGPTPSGTGGPSLTSGAVGTHNPALASQRCWSFLGDT